MVSTERDCRESVLGVRGFTMLRIGFIFPSSHYLFDPFKGDPHTHFHLLTLLEDRLGAQVEVKLIDLRGIERKFALYHIPECDIFLQSIYTLDVDEQIKLVAGLRKDYPQAVHLAGGPHAQEFPKEMQEFFDAIFIGECEELLFRAIEDFERNDLQKLYSNPQGVDVNEYAIPRRNFLAKSNVSRTDMLSLKRDSSFKDLRGTTVLFSRGCPYKCAFCAMEKTRKGAGIRYRRPDLIVEEIEYLKRDYGIQGISLLDEIGIPMRRKEAITHLEAIGSCDVVWRGQCRVDGVTPEIAELARQSGCVALGLGVESAWQISLDAIDKQINLTRAKETIRILKAHGIEVRLYMILGLPGEPPDIVQRSWDFVQETDPDLVILSLLTMRPGTIIYEDPARFGIKRVSKDWENTRHMHGRYDEEVPELTFEYEEVTPWGKSLTNEQIVGNYVELQNRLSESGLNTM